MENKEKVYLKGMTDFVLEMHEKLEFVPTQKEVIGYFTKTKNLANFLKQPLCISQFVACKLVGGVWIVLEEPTHIFSDNPDKSMSEMYQNNPLVKEYQEAKQRVLFEGFEYDFKMEYCHNNDISFDEEYFEGKTIEDLTKYNLELSQTAVKTLEL